MNSVRQDICSAKTVYGLRMSLLFHNYFFGTVEDGIAAI
jgi:hypothetical protein